MTKDVTKMKYKEAQAIYDDSSQPSELREQAKNRMDSIRAWLKSKDADSPKTTSKGERRGITEDDFKSLPDSTKQSIKEDASNLLAMQLCRIYNIEKGLADRGIAGNGPFVGMLYNNQVATN